MKAVTRAAPRVEKHKEGKWELVMNLRCRGIGFSAQSRE